MTPTETRACPDCGLLQVVPPLEGGTVAHCGRCNGVLRRASRQTEGFPLICACAAACLYLAALVTPFMSVRAPGRESRSTLFDGPHQLDERGMWPLAILVTITLVIVPFLKLSGLLTVLIVARQPEPPRWLGRVFRWTRNLSPWSMLEVFLLAAAVAYTRLDALARVAIEPAMYLLAGVMLCTVAAESTLDVEAIWDLTESGRSDDAKADQRSRLMCHGCGRLEHAQPGEECWRCGALLHPRRPGSIERTWALVISAVLLYVPANILPVMTVKRLGQGGPNTILSGVTELVHANLVPLALLVFTASFIVPIAKILGLALMLVATHFRSARQIRMRTKLYRVIEAIGRWSMLDVFVLSTLVGLVHFGFIGSVTPGWGAVAFGGVVVLTMLAASAFDPRLMWDAISTPSSSQEHS